MADLLKFKHGLQKNLTENSPAVVPGTVYITRDERAMYVDLPPYEKSDGQVEAAKRIRIGDMRVYEYLDEMKAALTSDMSSLTTSALYYAEKDNATNKNVINALLKWNGSQFIQLNKTSDIAANLNSLESRISAVEGVSASNKTKIENLETAVNTTIPNTYATKSALNTAVNDLNTAIGKKANQSDLTALNTTVTNLSTTVGNNKSAADTAFEAVNVRIDNEIERATTAEAAKLNKNLGTSNASKVLVTNGSGEISTSSITTTKLGYLTDVTSNIQNQINTISGNVTTVSGNLASAVTRIDAAEDAIETNTSNISKNSDDIGDIKNDISALKGTGEGSIAAQIAAESKLREDADKNFAEDIEALEGEIAKLKTADEGFVANYLKKSDAPGYADILTKTSAGSTYATKDELNTAKSNLLGTSSDASSKNTIYGAKKAAAEASSAVATEKTRAEGVESGLNTRLSKVEEFFTFATEADKNALYDTLKEIQDYIESDVTAAATMTGNINKNTTDITNLKGRMTTAEGNITTVTNDLATEKTNRENAVTGAINTAKEYTDSALTWGTF